jgi:hypothetical protein
MVRSMRIDYTTESLTREDVRARLRALSDYLLNRHGIKIQWANEDSASFKGKYMVVKIEGELSIEDGMVKLRGKDPGLLWRKKAKNYLQGKLCTYLDPNTPVEDLPRNK